MPASSKASPFKEPLQGVFVVCSVVSLEFKLARKEAWGVARKRSDWLTRADGREQEISAANGRF